MFLCFPMKTKKNRGHSLWWFLLLRVLFWPFKLYDFQECKVNKLQAYQFYCLWVMTTKLSVRIWIYYLEEELQKYQQEELLRSWWAWSYTWPLSWLPASLARRTRRWRPNAAKRIRFAARVFQVVTNASAARDTIASRSEKLEQDTLDSVKLTAWP